MLKAIILLFVAMGVIYFLFYPFLKQKVNRKKAFRWFIIIYIIAAVASTVSNYFLKADSPEPSTKVEK